MEEWHDIEVFQDEEGTYGSDEVELSGDPKIMKRVGLPMERYVPASRLNQPNPLETGFAFGGIIAAIYILGIIFGFWTAI